MAAYAMVATLPGRTQGLGLITEPLLRDLGLGRLGYARLNVWTTLAGAGLGLVFGRMQDRWGSRRVLALLGLTLGGSVVALGSIQGVAGLAAGLVLARGLGQTALSAASIGLVGQSFPRGLPWAMAVYSVVLSIGFMAAFPLAGWAVEQVGWRAAWRWVGVGVAGLAPLALTLVHPPPPDTGPSRGDPADGLAGEADLRLGEALGTPAFWVFGLSSALYLLVASGIGLFNESILAELGFGPRIYHVALGVTALTGLGGNLVGGWLGARHRPGVLLAGALYLLAAGLAALPHLRSTAAVLTQAGLLGLSGGFVTVVFFTFWPRVYGRRHLGQVQGAAQALTVVASALGPLALAGAQAWTGSYAAIFRLLAVGVAGAAVAVWWVPLPGRRRAPDIPAG
ncbi:MAG: MFS transporter [Verrucomicrobiota bacterium]